MKILKRSILQLGEKIDQKLGDDCYNSIDQMQNTFHAVSLRNASMRPRMEITRP